MKSSLLSSFAALALISSALAAIGDKCRSSEGTGTCKSVSSCTSGFTVTGACPNDPADVKCCISKDCTLTQKAPLISLGGHCVDKDVGKCSGGHFEKNLCPGDASVQCCIKVASAAPPAPTTAPPPPPPKECPTFKKISHFGPDDIVFSRAKTHQVPGIFNTVKGALEVCEIVGAIIGEGVGGIPCGIGAIGVDQFVSHASECDDKNQCLMLKDRFIPECIGGADCC